MQHFMQKGARISAEVVLSIACVSALQRTLPSTVWRLCHVTPKTLTLTSYQGRMQPYRCWFPFQGNWGLFTGAQGEGVLGHRICALVASLCKLIAEEGQQTARNQCKKQD